MAASVSEGKTVMVQGRLVWVSGDLFKGRVKTQFGTQTPVLDDQGEKVMEYGFGLAVPKSVLGQNGAGQPGEIWTALHEEAFKLFPSRQIPPGFAMKYKDGDGLDDQGLPFANREGYAGCIVIACTTRIPIKFFRYENGANIQINEGIKCGDYVNVQLNVKAHPAIGQGKAGIYVNPLAVQFLGYGKEIVNTPSGDQIFGTQAPAVPQGASLTPVAPQGGFLVPSAAPSYPAAAAPQAPAPAHYGVLPGQFQQPQSPPPQAPAPAWTPQGAPQPPPQAQPAWPQQQQAQPAWSQQPPQQQAQGAPSYPAAAAPQAPAPWPQAAY